MTDHQILPLTVTMRFGNIENTVHPVLLRDRDSVLLIDCGFIDSLPILESELGKLGLTADCVQGIVLTHHDHDHLGAAAAFKRRNPNVRIYASAGEEPYISGREKPLRLRQAEEMQATLPPEQQDFGRAFCEMLRQVEPVLVDETLREGDRFDWCGGCRVVSTPGHTPGHISLWMERPKWIIAGDAIALEDKRPVIANPQFTLDAEKAAESMEKLLHMGAEVICCYHGGVYPIPEDALR